MMDLEAVMMIVKGRKFLHMSLRQFGQLHKLSLHFSVSKIISRMEKEENFLTLIFRT